MNEATQRLVGEDDFCNFCKINESVNNFVRRIYSAEVKVTEHKEGGYSMCEFSITATAYLWHQIRCIMGVLILIGQGSEKPEVCLVKYQNLTIILYCNSSQLCSLKTINSTIKCEMNAVL